MPRPCSCDPISNNGNEKGRSTYALQLEQSPLFAESGGQPSDQGTLRVLGHEAQGGSGTQAVVIQIESVVWKQVRAECNSYAMLCKAFPAMQTCTSRVVASASRQAAASWLE